MEPSANNVYREAVPGVRKYGVSSIIMHEFARNHNVVYQDAGALCLHLFYVKIIKIHSALTQHLHLYTFRSCVITPCDQSDLC
jgi:hypothetical protein